MYLGDNTSNPMMQSHELQSEVKNILLVQKYRDGSSTEDMSII